MLPPVIEIDFYDNWISNPPPKEIINDELNVMLEKLEANYGMKPIICVSEQSYSYFISGSYQEYPIWIRDVLCEPALSDSREWTFWQYTDKGHLPDCGNAGFIDLDVFAGTRDQFNNFPSKASLPS